MTHDVKKSGFGMRAVWFLAVFGLLLILYRFIFGLGAVTNLSDGYPWGLWIGFDILAGIALAAGGFVVAGLVHLFGGRKYHALSRAAILTALLGYLLFAFGLLVDLGRWWNLWRAMFYWHHESPMFEVAWCVMMYTTTLILEFAPVVFERYKLEKLHRLWRQLTPFVIIVMLTMFMIAMTYSLIWGAVLFGILLAWEVLMRTGIMPRDQQMPILMIMAGVMFSTMHQSSLGAVFLTVPSFLHGLWFSPALPLFFLYSAIMAGTAMVMFESLLSERALAHEARFDLLRNFAKAMPWLLGVYLLVKIGDILVRGVAPLTAEWTPQAVSWWGEMIVGVIVPFVLFLTPEVRASKSGILWSSTCVVIGLVWNRLNVAIVGYMVPSFESYYPFWSEIFITAGIVSVGLIAFRWIVLNMPVYEHEPSGSHEIAGA